MNAPMLGRFPVITLIRHLELYAEEAMVNCAKSEWLSPLKSCMFYG